MKVELYLNHANEITAFAEFAAKLASYRATNEKREDRIFDEEVTTAPATTSAPETAPVVVEVKERKPRAKKTETPEPAVAAPVVSTLPEPTPAPAPEPATAPVPAPAAAPAAPSQTKVQLEDKVRLLAKTNFAAVKALLAKYGVERFGKLAEDKYATFGPELFALPEYPPVTA